MLRGSIVFQQATFKTLVTTKLPCVVKNISVTGAKIDTLKIQTVPAEFVLELPDHKLNIPSQVRWRHKTEIGVAFSIDAASIEKELCSSEKLTA